MVFVVVGLQSKVISCIIVTLFLSNQVNFRILMSSTVTKLLSIAKLALFEFVKLLCTELVLLNLVSQVASL